MTASHAPIEHPAAWCGVELTQAPDWLQTLSPEHWDEIEAAAVTSMHLSDADCSTQTFPLPKTGPLLLQIQDDLENGCGATLLRGLNPERLTQNPLPIIQRMFLGLASHIGTPISQSAKGERIFSVRDAGHALDDPRARGPNTAKKLSFHTDRCDVIAFACLQQAKSGGENMLVSSMSLYNRLLTHHPELLQTLCEPYLYKRHNVDTANTKPHCRQPVFSFQNGHFACSYLRVLIDRADADPDAPNMTNRQRRALEALEALAEEPSMHVRFTQQPGDILLLNNWVILHRRTAFEDHPDEAKRRHILRIWLSVPNSRPLNPMFKDNFGATEAGALRGGMRATGA